MKIVSTAALNPDQKRLIAAAAGEAEIVDRTCRTVEEISALLEGGCDVLLTFRIPEDLVSRAPTLKWVQLLSAGADHALKTNLAGTSIPVTTASGIHATPIAEYIIGSMLIWAHRFHVSIRAQEKHAWITSGRFMRSVSDLRGKTVGIVGYGSIGREAARIADAMGMTVLALKREPQNRSDDGWSPEGVGDPEGKIPQRFFGPDQRNELLAASDFVVVTLPLTEATRGFIGRREFEAVKPGAYLVNIGRGGVVDEQAMIDALREKRLGGAGLDVFEREPLGADSALWDIEEVVLTPHMSGANSSYMDRACELFVENLGRFRNGERLLNLVDRALGY